MFALSLLPQLLAADNRLIKLNLPNLTLGDFSVPMLAVILLGLVVASFLIGIWFASAMRMKDYGWKVGLILATTFLSLGLVLFGQYKLGVDLQGGVILVYEVDESATAEQSETGEGWTMSRLVTVISERLNETGLKEIVVRPFGPKQIEIVVPEVDPQEVEKIKLQVVTGGTLQFMIVATENKDAQLFELARQQAALPDVATRSRRDVKDEDGTKVGFWARLDREELKGRDEEDVFFRVPGAIQGLLRDAATGQIIELSREQKQVFAQSQPLFLQHLKDRGITRVDALMVYHEDHHVEGGDLASARTGFDRQLRPKIDFRMKGEGIWKFGQLTGQNVNRMLAVVFDNRVISAPNINEKISESGEITGDFSQEEVQFIVDMLKSGSLPVMLQEKPISENQIGAILGLDTIKKGSVSIVIALGVVLLFLAGYYRYAGLIACFALTLNLLVTVAFMVLFQAPFTLPGLAGLVLTVAMSVDANILISERIREELARGATLRMAIRNGFDKALSAIIDGNLTTFLTAFVLYLIGTDQIKGFGMTLMIGNITSMFTAIFCARVIFDVSERTRFIQRLSMANFLTNPQVDWVKFFFPAVSLSVVLFLIGAVATVARGKGLFDTDLAGGTSVTGILKDPMSIEEVRRKMDGVLEEFVDPVTNSRVDHNVYEITVEAEGDDTVYKIDSSLEDIDLLKEKAREAMRMPGGEDGWRTFEVAVLSVNERTISRGSTGPSLSSPDRPATTPPATNGSGTKTGNSPADSSSGGAGNDLLQEPTAEKAAEKTATEAAQPAEAPPATPAGDGDKKDKATPETPAPPAVPAPPAPTANYETSVELEFPKSAITAEALRERIRKSAAATINREPTVMLENPQRFGEDNSPYEKWTVKLPLDKAQTEKVLAHLKTDLEKDVVWQTSSKIGGQVSVDTRWKALTALAVSLIGIVSYVWFRFQKIAWGLAAVAALAHDALAMLTAIAASYWLAPFLGFAGVEEFKISLPVVAAFLTILGYSVNDTIVIFDRLREIRGKSPDITRQMLNDAVNQTLGRTIILAGLTLVVTLILYFFGGPGIHAFAFALVIGVISGLYTTLVIAAPLLWWLLGKQESRVAKPEVRPMAKTA